MIKTHHSSAISSQFSQVDLSHRIENNSLHCPGYIAAKQLANQHILLSETYAIFWHFEVEAKIEELCLIHEKFLDNLINLHQFKLCDKENLNLYALKFKKFDTKLRVKHFGVIFSRKYWKQKHCLRAFGSEPDR